jgi:hypothetical protein
MATPRYARRGGIRCEVARDVADALEVMAGEADSRAAKKLTYPERVEDYAEARTLRSIVLAIRRINLQE